MWRRNPAAAPHKSDLIAAPQFLSGRYQELREMRVVGMDVGPMIHHYQPPIAAVPLRKNHDAIGSGVHRHARRRADVHALVKSAFFREWIRTGAEGRKQTSFERPDRGRSEERRV